MYTIEADGKHRATRRTLGLALKYATELRARVASAGQDELRITICGLPVEAYADQARTSHIPYSAENAPVRYTRRGQDQD
jgi:hypothetical protein